MPTTTKRTPAAAKRRPSAVDKDYPVRDFKDEASGRIAQVVSVRDADGRWISQIMHDSKIRAFGRTRKEAEDAVLVELAELEMDDADMAFIEKRQHGPWMDLKDILKKYGR
ncbi:MAG: hypothetical protein FJW32_11175 [Acidobacteria bacterium]|nr:hypothetical protein [Acidobacteriota bacterium]